MVEAPGKELFVSSMIWSMLIIIGIYAVIVGMLIMWNNEPITRGKK